MEQGSGTDLEAAARDVLASIDVSLEELAKPFEQVPEGARGWHSETVYTGFDDVLRDWRATLAQAVGERTGESDIREIGAQGFLEGCLAASLTTIDVERLIKMLDERGFGDTKAGGLAQRLLDCRREIDERHALTKESGVA